jgi:hypothetical protein
MQVRKRLSLIRRRRAGARHVQRIQRDDLVLRSTPADLTVSYDIPGVSLKTPFDVNLNALYSVREKWDAFLTIRNLTDSHYALRGVAGPGLQETLSLSAGIRFRY